MITMPQFVMPASAMGSPQRASLPQHHKRYEAKAKHDRRVGSENGIKVVLCS